MASKPKCNHRRPAFLGIINGKARYRCSRCNMKLGKHERTVVRMRSR